MSRVPYHTVYLGEDDPRADGNGQAYVHRLMMERELGRALREREVVRFRDGDRRNLKLSNLEVITTRPRKPYGRKRAAPSQARTLQVLELHGSGTAHQVASWTGKHLDHVRSDLRRLQRKGLAASEQGIWRACVAGDGRQP